MGLPEDRAGAAVRVSLGWASRPADVDRFVDAWEKLYRRLAGRGGARRRSRQEGSAGGGVSYRPV